MTITATPTTRKYRGPADRDGQRIGDYIQVFSGRAFFPLDPRPEEIDIIDIAHALSRITRYTGHTRGDFGLSVAQHSVMVSKACDPADALAGLLHDASEAYTSDVSRPLKYLPEFASFREIEDRLQGAIYERFGLDRDMPASVKLADNRALAAEVRDLMTPDPDIWGKWLFDIDPLPGTVTPWWPGVAKAEFLERYEELTGKDWRES